MHVKMMIELRAHAGLLVLASGTLSEERTRGNAKRRAIMRIQACVSMPYVRQLIERPWFLVHGHGSAYMYDTFPGLSD